MNENPHERRIHDLGRRLIEIRGRRQDLDKEEAAIQRELAQLAMDAAHGLDAAHGPDAGGDRRVRLSGSLVPMVSNLTPLPKGSRGHGDRLVALLKEKPRAPQPWLCEKLYGEYDAEAMGRLSSQLDYLRRQGRVRSLGNGEWEAT